jgi:integrase
LDLDGAGTIMIVAGYSKRRRKDTIPLHPWVVARLRRWLPSKPHVEPSKLLFELRTAKGHYRKTAKMMKNDLAAARHAWIEESLTEIERHQRQSSAS